MTEPAPGGGYQPQSLAARIREARDLRGTRAVARDFARFGARLFAGLPRTRAGSHGSFEFDGESYPYLFHRYKHSWLRERAVEVPVVQRIVDLQPSARVLEVGNVLSHYRRQDHLVVDKYEQAAGILNRDILDLGEIGSFDLIVAISTLEHVGWDEHPRRPARAVEALRALLSRLRPGGRLVITHPVGYNPVFDEALREGAVPFSRAGALRRVGGGTRWRQVPVEEAWGAPYDFLLYSARAVVIAEFRADVGSQ
jgi:SAM-dependent methyltransferase